MNETINSSFDACILTDRALVKIGGTEATGFLQNLVTCEIEHLENGQAAFGALLTPQGKILFDFFIQRIGDHYLVDIAADQRETFIKRLTFYRLRAEVTLDVVDALAVKVSATSLGNSSFADPRVAQLGFRTFIKENSPDFPTENEVDYHRLRLSFGVPIGGIDYAFGDVFPHEVLMDQFEVGSGIAFDKGCYVGQEVVSRMQHRTTTRKRIVIASGSEALPPAGSDIISNGKRIGAMGSSINTAGLALVRLDRATKAMETEIPIITNDVTLSLTIPKWAKFQWPNSKPASNDG